MNDGEFKYKLYGKTGDFKSFQRVNGEAGGLEARIDVLAFYDGVVLPYKGGIPNVLDRPRAVCMRDGRIFIDERMATDRAYLDAVPSIVESAGKIFGNKGLLQLYAQLYHKVAKS